MPHLSPTDRQKSTLGRWTSEFTEGATKARAKTRRATVTTAGTEMGFQDEEQQIGRKSPRDLIVRWPFSTLPLGQEVLQRLKYWTPAPQFLPIF